MEQSCTASFGLTSNMLTLSVFESASIRRVLKERSRLSVSQFRILSYLREKEGSPTAAVIGRSLGISASCMSEALTALRQWGFVDAVKMSYDKRAQSFAITDEGANEIASIEHEIVKKYVRHIWSHLSQDQQRLLTEVIGRSCPYQNGYLRKEPTFMAVYAVGSLAAFDMLGRTVKATGISLNAFRVLFEICQKPQGVTQSTIAKTLYIRHNELSRIVSTLVAKGYVNQEPSPWDVRANLLDLTSDGYAYLAQVLARVEEFYFSEKVSMTPAEVRCFAEMADLVVAREAGSLQSLAGIAS